MRSKRIAALVIPALAAVFVAAIATAQSPGIGFKKDSTLTGTGSSGSPIGVNTSTIQARVTGTCGAGSAIGAIDAAGGVTCNAGSTVTATGTSNTVAKFTGTSALGNTTYPITDASGTLTLGDSNTDQLLAQGSLARFRYDATHYLDIAPKSNHDVSLITSGGSLYIASYGATNSAIFGTTGNLAINSGNASSVIGTANSDALQVLKSGSGLTNTASVLNASSSATYTPASGVSLTGVKSYLSSSRSGGAGTLTNLAGDFSATGADANYALRTFDGNVQLNANSGNTGIGDSTPSNPLTVNGTISSTTSGGFCLDEARTMCMAVSGGNSIQFRTNNVDSRVTIDSSGNVTHTGDTTLGDASTDTTTINGIANVQNLRGKVQTDTSTGTQTITLNADTTVLRLNPATTLNVVGITGGADGRFLFIENVGSANAGIYDEHASASAANRIVAGMSGGFGTLVNGGGLAWAVYDGTSSRWRVHWLLAKYSPAAFTALGDISTSSNLFAGYRLQGGTLRIPTLTQSSLTSGTLNNWNPDGVGSFDIYAAGVIDVTAATGAVTVTGIDATNAADGDFLWIHNRSGQTMTYNHQSASSSAANRLTLLGGVNATVGTGGSIAFFYKSGVGFVEWAINSQIADAKAYSTGTAPTLSSCGTSPTVTGNDTAGTITLGSGTATSCTLTFSSAYSVNAPACVLTSQITTRGDLVFSAKSTSAFTLTSVAGANMASGKIDYFCRGIQ